MTAIKHRIELVKLLPANSCVAEVGCAEGLFSRDLLEAGVERLYMIDNWGHIPSVTGDGNFPEEWHQKNYNAAFNRVQPYGWRAKLLRGMSTEMAKHILDESLDMVYLDANHTDHGVSEDIAAYWSKLKVGGIMAFHDYENDWDYGVKSAVTRFCLNHNIEINLIPENSKVDAGAWVIKK